MPLSEIQLRHMYSLLLNYNPNLERSKCSKDSSISPLSPNILWSLTSAIASLWGTQMTYAPKLFPALTPGIPSSKTRHSLLSISVLNLAFNSFNPSCQISGKGLPLPFGILGSSPVIITSNALKASFSKVGSFMMELFYSGRGAERNWNVPFL